MVPDISLGTIIAEDFTVQNVKHNIEIKPTYKPTIGNKPNPIISNTVIELDAKYENTSWLLFYTFAEAAPPLNEWDVLFFSGLPVSDIRIDKTWKPENVRQECVCLSCKARTFQGTWIAVSEMLAACEKTVVAARITWFGFPIFNRFSVRFKPGMHMRTEKLLMAGLDMV